MSLSFSKKESAEYLDSVDALIRAQSQNRKPENCMALDVSNTIASSFSPGEAPTRLAGGPGFFVSLRTLSTGVFTGAGSLVGLESADPVPILIPQAEVVKAGAQIH